MPKFYKEMTQDEMRTELFKQWQYMSHQVMRLNGILQNQMPIMGSDVQKWLQEYKEVKEGMIALAKDTGIFLAEISILPIEDGQ